MQDPISKHSLREAAIAVEQRSSDAMPLRFLWRALRDGSARVSDAFFSAERCYFVLDWQIAESQRNPLSTRRRDLLEGLLCGEYPKALAARLGVSTSTISTIGKLALQQLGINGSLARLNPILAVSALAERYGNEAVTGRPGDFIHKESKFRVVGIARPDHGLALVLPPAQYAVVRGVVEGKNYLEIARARGTSTRTVANQLCAVFRRLGVSGRGSLLSRLMTEHVAYPIAGLL